MVSIPIPGKNEDEKSFINRCVSIVISEGTTDDQKQAVAICYSIWKEKHKENENHNGKIYLTLNAVLNCRYDTVQLSETQFNDNLIIGDSTILVGDGIYNGMFFPKEELEKAYLGWDKVPINLNHSDDKVEDIVGFVENPRFIDNMIVVSTFLDKDTVKYNEAMGFIKSRTKAGRVPNVSVGVWVDRVEEEMSDGETRMTARNLEADHLALVVHGACSPEDGCGIGICNNNEVPIDVEPSENITIMFEDYVNDDKVYKDLKKKILKEKIKGEMLK